MAKLLVVALVLALLGVLVVILAGRGRGKRGLGVGETVALDDVTLYSKQLQLVGRPDRIVRDGELVIPEEWKSSKRVRDSHKLQLGTYFLLIEDLYEVRPPHGFVVLGDGSRVRAENTEALRSDVLKIAAKIRELRRKIGDKVPMRQPGWKCRACGQRGNCRHAST